MPFSVAPLAISSSMNSTLSRVPLTQGLPPSTAGSLEIIETLGNSLTNAVYHGMAEPRGRTPGPRPEVVLHQPPYHLQYHLT